MFKHSLTKLDGSKSCPKHEKSFHKDLEGSVKANLSTNRFPTGSEAVCTRASVSSDANGC
jgi:hypothetical protein